MLSIIYSFSTTLIIIRNAKSGWLDGAEASIRLGFSEKSLNCWRKCGYLKSGKHWKEQYYADKKRIIYDIDQCSEEMNEWWGRDAINGP